jgi:hypothetical protein
MTQQEQIEYDARKKTLRRNIRIDDDIRFDDFKAGTLVIRNTQDYSEEGIKHILGELKKQRLSLHSGLTQANKVIESTEHLANELTAEEREEMEHTRKVLQNIGRLQERDKAMQQRDSLLKDLKEVNGQDKRIRDAVGNHLKLE